MLSLSVVSTYSKGPDWKSFSLGVLLCPAAMTLSLPCFFRSSMVNSDPICPVAPVMRIFFMSFFGI